MPVYSKAINMGQTKNTGGIFRVGRPVLLVMHYTAGGSGEGSAHYLFGPHTPSSSAHFVIDRDGTVRQLSDTTRTTWHAGLSAWKGMKGINAYGIGIEHANYGYAREGVNFKNKFRARHKNGGPVQDWEVYPEPQLAASVELTRWILRVHPTIREIVGHDDIAPKRKSDPGPAFPMARFQALIEHHNSKVG